MKKLALLVCALLAPASAFAQAFPSTTLQNSPGNYARVVPNAPIIICTAGDLAIPCTTKVQTYTDQNLTTACTLSNNVIGAPISGTGCNNPGASDANGNYVAFLPAGTYRLCVYAQNYVCQTVSPGAGGIFGNVNPAAQFKIPYYSVLGTQNILSGDACTTDGNGNETCTSLTAAGAGTGVVKMKIGAAPANPASGFGAAYVDSTTGYLSCLTASGLSCLSTPGTLNATTFTGSDIGAQVNNAMTTACANTSIGRIYIPPGTYSYTTPIVHKCSNVRLYGAGPATSLNYTGVNTSPAITIGDADPATIVRPAVSDFALTSPNGTGVGIKLNGGVSIGASIQRIVFPTSGNGFGTFIQHGDTLGSSYDNWIDHNQLALNPSNNATYGSQIGIDVPFKSHNLSIDHNQIQDDNSNSSGSIGVRVAQSTSVKITNNNIEGMGAANVQIGLTGGVASQSTVISNNYFETLKASTLDVEVGANALGTTIDNNWHQNDALQVHFIQIDSGSAGTLVGGMFSGNAATTSAVHNLGTSSAFIALHPKFYSAAIGTFTDSTTGVVSFDDPGLGVRFGPTVNANNFTVLGAPCSSTGFLCFPTAGMFVKVNNTQVASSGASNWNFSVPVNMQGNTFTGTQVQSGAINGGSQSSSSTQEVVTLNTGAAFTDSTTNLLPAGAIIDAVTYRITTTITTAASFTIGDATTAARFCTTQSTLTAGTTGFCFVQADQTGAAGPRQTAGAKVRITLNANPGAGVIEYAVFYHTWIAPTS